MLFLDFFFHRYLSYKTRTLEARYSQTKNILSTKFAYRIALMLLFWASNISISQNDSVMFDNEKKQNRKNARMWKRKENDDVMMQ
jgi:hypothetical protein